MLQNKKNVFFIAVVPAVESISVLEIKQTY